MKKLLVIAGLCLILTAMPMTIASPQLGVQQHANPVQRHINPTPVNDTFTGIFAIKNETSVIPIGTMSGTFTEHEFEGVWALDDGTATGTFSGWMWSHLCWGTAQTDGSNESQWFGALFRVNETDNSFQAISIVVGDNGYAIRYATGDIQ